MSYKIYPVVPTSPACDDYRIFVNGTEARTNTARVSAVPFNRRWPGHQRGEEQTEAVQFLSLSFDASDAPLSFEIVPQTPFEEVKIRPQSLGIVPHVENGVIRFTLDRPAYFTVEPYGRNRALHIFADPAQPYRVDAESPDVLYFGAGEHDVGVLELKSNQTVFIDEGAVVYACIRAIDAENVKILGRGILDNSKNKETILYEVNAENNSMAVNNAIREHTVQLEYCKNVEIDGITIRDSLVYNVRPIGCEHLRIKNVKIIGCWRYNSDGIDMHNCVDVHISDCFLRTFDDSICVKGFDCYYDGDVEAAVHAAMYRGGKAYDVFKNCLVENCVIWNDWGKCLEIGAETRAEEISGIAFRNCDLIHLTGNALDCMNVDYADVHDVTFSNIRIEADETVPAPSIQGMDSERYVNTDPQFLPPMICVEVTYHPEYSAGGGRRGKNRDLRFENIRVLTDKDPKFRFSGYDEAHKTENVLISNFFLNGVPLTEMPHASVGEFTDNVRLVCDPYAQMDKNNVSSKGQLKESRLVKFDFCEHGGKRIMFVGNSITLHGVLPEIGWHWAHGMAASSKEKDYVHLVEQEVLKKAPDAAFCICQVANWEREYKNGQSVHPLYSAARDFGADIIVIRCVENCPKDGLAPETFKSELDALIRYLDKEGKASVIITTGFWHHPLDASLCQYAEENGLPCITLGDLGEDDAMKALGLFAHDGVANHPGDLGMKRIAERISEVLLEYV